MKYKKKDSRLKIKKKSHKILKVKVPNGKYYLIKQKKIKNHKRYISLEKQFKNEENYKKLLKNVLKCDESPKLVGKLIPSSCYQFIDVKSKIYNFLYFRHLTCSQDIQP